MFSCQWCRSLVQAQYREESHPAVVFSSGHFPWHLSNSITHKLGNPDRVWNWRPKLSSYLEPTIRNFCAEHVISNWRPWSLEAFSINTGELNVWRPVCTSINHRTVLVLRQPYSCHMMQAHGRKSNFLRHIGLSETVWSSKTSSTIPPFTVLLSVRFRPISVFLRFQFSWILSYLCK